MSTIGDLRRELPGPMQGYFQMHAETTKDGALPKRVKELVALATSIWWRASPVVRVEDEYQRWVDAAGDGLMQIVARESRVDRPDRAPAAVGWTLDGRWQLMSTAGECPWGSDPRDVPAGSAVLYFDGHPARSQFQGHVACSDWLADHDEVTEGT